jgi:hypothetical protein
MNQQQQQENQYMLPPTTPAEPVTSSLPMPSQTMPAQTASATPPRVTAASVFGPARGNFIDELVKTAFGPSQRPPGRSPMQTTTPTQQRGMPRVMPGYGGMPMGGYGGFGGQQPGGAFFGPPPMLPAANPWTGQAGAGTGPPGMGLPMSGAMPAWAEPWSMTG